MSDQKTHQDIKNEITASKILGSPVFKYVSLILSVFLIVLGAMSVYEGQLPSSEDRSVNVGLIIMSTLSLILAAFFLIVLIYVAKRDQNTTFTQLYTGLTILIFTIVVGAISLVCAVDIPNVDYRGTLLWVVGAITVIAGVAGVILSSLYIAKSYGVRGLEKLK